MNFKWIDYSPELADTVEGFLDKEAVKMTGIDEGFNDYYEYWVNEDETVVGENFWCKVIYNEDTPIGVAAFGKSPSGEFVLSEFIVSPYMRGQGLGTSALSELITNGEMIIGQKIDKALAVIFPGNTASQKCFEKVGFKLHSVHPDGDALYYRYSAT